MPAAAAALVLKGDRISFRFPEGVFTGVITDACLGKVVVYRNVTFDDGDRLKLNLSAERQGRDGAAAELEEGQWCFVHRIEPGAKGAAPGKAAAAALRQRQQCYGSGAASSPGGGGARSKSPLLPRRAEAAAPAAALRPVLASVLRGATYGSAFNPSDHHPVCAVFDLRLRSAGVFRV